MPLQHTHAEFDLTFRPASYWDLADPVGSIVQSITGENRRRMARDFVTGSGAAPEWICLVSKRQLSAADMRFSQGSGFG